MANRDDKVAIVEEITGKLNKAKSVVLANYRGLTVAKDTELRRRLRQAGVDYQVLKNTMTQRALEKAGLPAMDEALAGPTAIAFGYEDPTVPVKILSDFAKDNKQLELKAGIFGGRAYNGAEMREIANLPPRPVLLARVVGQIQWPLTGLAFVLAGPVRNLAYAVDAIRKQKEAQSAAD